MHHVTDTMVYDEAGGSVGGWRVQGEAGGWRMAAALQTVEAAASGAADSRRGQRERGRERGHLWLVAVTLVRAAAEAVHCNTVP